MTYDFKYGFNLPTIVTRVISRLNTLVIRIFTRLIILFTRLIIGIIG